LKIRKFFKDGKIVSENKETRVIYLLAGEAMERELMK